MIKINRKVEYALIVLKHMLDKECGELTTAREICEKFDTPFDTTAKVMQIMASSGILNSLKGVKGGYSLCSDLSKTSYFSLSEMIEGKSFTMDCTGLNCELLGKCNITFPIKRLNQHLERFFKNLSLKELLKDNGPFELNDLKKMKEEVHE